MPNIIKTNVPTSEMLIRSQFMGVVPRTAARAFWMTPIIGFIARTQEYFPAIDAGYITGVT